MDRCEYGTVEIGVLEVGFAANALPAKGEGIRILLYCPAELAGFFRVPDLFEIIDGTNVGQIGASFGIQAAQPNMSA